MIDMYSFPMNIIALVTLEGRPTHFLLNFLQQFSDYSGVSELRESISREQKMCIIKFNFYLFKKKNNCSFRLLIFFNQIYD